MRAEYLMHLKKHAKYTADIALQKAELDIFSIKCSCRTSSHY